jgi:RNA polymerase sigma-70 factor (ECF subfamily)
MPEPEAQFIHDLTDWQNRLFGYLVSLLGNVHDARDVLQETNLVMWRRMDTFTPGTDFGAWARKCAYFQAMAFFRDRKRGPSLLEQEVLELIAAEQEEHPGPGESEHKLALRDCLARLDDGQRMLMKRRYQDQVQVQKLAAEHGKSESAMKMTLLRIRELLHVCITAKLKELTP